MKGLQISVSNWHSSIFDLRFNFISGKQNCNSLKAAGTPMIKALPLMASLKLTLLPGEFSTKTSRLGSLSPTLMKERVEAWKLLDEREALRATRRRAIVDAIVRCFQLVLIAWQRRLEVAGIEVGVKSKTGLASFA